MDPRIADYIRANRDRYTREAIRQQLLAAGYAPAQIDATWAMLDAPDPDATVGQRFWGRFWLYLLGANLVVFLAVGLLSGMLGALSGGTGVLLVILAIALAIGALIAWAVVAATRPTQLGRGTAITIGAVMPLLFAFLIGGTCYALASGMGVARPTYAGEMEVRIDPPLGIEGVGTATCSGPSGSTGFSAYAPELRTAVPGQSVSVGIDAYPGPAGGELVPSISITVFDSPRDPLPETWTNSPDTSVVIEAAPDGLSGELTFTTLSPELVGAPGEGRAPEPISGMVTWTCE